MKLSGVGRLLLTAAWGVGERTVCPTCEAVVKDKWSSSQRKQQRHSRSEFDSHSDDSVEDLDVFLVRSASCDSPSAR